MSNFFCIDSQYWDFKPPVIQGTFDNEVFKWISITTTICNNKTSNVRYLISKVKLLAIRDDLKKIRRWFF